MDAYSTGSDNLETKGLPKSRLTLQNENEQKENPPPKLATDICQLPPYSPMTDPIFMWDGYDTDTFIQNITTSYAEVVHWRKNMFMVPYGNVGKSFVSELAKLYRAYADRSALEAIALKASTVMSILLLQKPHTKSKPCDHTSCLKRRLEEWCKGKIDDLLIEGRAIQHRLPKWTAKSCDKDEVMARSFSKLMFQGKTKSALQLLTQHDKGGKKKLDRPHTLVEYAS